MTTLQRKPVNPVGHLTDALDRIYRHSGTY